MKLLFLALAFGSIWTSTTAAQPAGDTSDSAVDELTAVPRELRAGDDVTVSGSGCAAGNQVLFELYDPDLHSSASGVAQGDGTFVQSVNLPSTTKVGRSWLRASCLTPESEQKVMEAVILVNRPQFVVTWVNVIFGIGTAFVTAGIGLAMLRQSDGRRHRSHRGVKRRRLGRKRSSGRRRRHSSSRSSSATESERSAEVRAGFENNGTRAADRPAGVE